MVFGAHAGNLAIGMESMNTQSTPVREVTDKALLHGFLIQDRIAAAYHLGDLDERYFDYCRFFVAGKDGIDGVLLLYTGLRMPAVLTLGSERAVEAILESPLVSGALPGRFYGHFMSHHVMAVQSLYRIDGMRSMMRMGLHKDAFTPAEETLDGVVKVGHADTADLMSLYRHYPDNFFEPYQLESGYYFGARDAGRLISVAGIHVFSEQYDVAALGNIVTHPDFRSRGHSRRCTTRLLNSLFERVSSVALNVEKENQAAQRVYRGLGFSDQLRYIEGLVVHR